jgi:hypothetical protein
MIKLLLQHIRLGVRARQPTAPPARCWSTRPYRLDMSRACCQGASKTYLGNGIAIPHGMQKDCELIRQTGVSVCNCLTVEWNEGRLFASSSDRGEPTSISAFFPP